MAERRPAGYPKLKREALTKEIEQIQEKIDFLII